VGEGEAGGRTWAWAGGRCRFTKASGRCRFTEGRTRGGSLPLTALIVVKIALGQMNTLLAALWRLVPNSNLTTSLCQDTGMG
jgi:hypothetical protein